MVVDVVTAAIVYWALINLATLLPLALFLRKYVVPAGGAYDAQVKIGIIEFLSPYHLGALSALSWTILFAPFLEEILFFAVPAMLGFWYSVFGLAAWASVHVARTAYLLRVVPDPIDRWGGLVSYTLFILLNGWLSLWLWAIGYGLLSIALHSMHNALAVAALATSHCRRTVRKGRSRRSPRRQYWVRT